MNNIFQDTLLRNAVLAHAGFPKRDQICLHPKIREFANYYEASVSAYIKSAQVANACNIDIITNVLRGVVSGTEQKDTNEQKNVPPTRRLLTTMLHYTNDHVINLIIQYISIQLRITNTTPFECCVWRWNGFYSRLVRLNLSDADPLLRGIRKHVKIAYHATTYPTCPAELIPSCGSFLSLLDIGATKLDTGFLLGHPSLQSIDFSNLDSITELAGDFLKDCSSLHSVDLTGFISVTHIDCDFLSGCSALRAIDIAPLANVQTIEGGFLRGCSSLETLNLSAFSKITFIAEHFLCFCHSLQTIDLSPLTRITSIAEHCLSYCFSLRDINLALLTDVTYIGPYFLHSCFALRNIDLTSFVNVTDIYNDFLSRCTSLKTIDLSALVNVAHIHDRFLYGCSALTVIDLSKLPRTVLYGIQNFVGWRGPE